MFDYSKLKGKIKEVFGSQKKFAKALGKDDSYVSKLLNNIMNFTVDNIDTWAGLLGIPSDEIGVYFFKKKEEC